ncbi:hypothetical protein [Acinetobacter bouvetii]|uniref:Carboxypeptidase regulatory-like domain-containing protein n=1 Tax=Acinetobacter bouvetii TaxID=202951 RepID=A0A811G8E2_9GAMM|nr:hypothetical protein [Acinetobacter bouvetii]CAB1208026.1 hypothetical protein SFB21_0265 [Acinetobacter bouvetii]
MILTTKLKYMAFACMLGVALTGCGSNSDSSSEPVKGEVTVEKSVSALIQSAQGTALSDVEITIAGQTFKTDVNGLAAFKVNLPQSTNSVVVRLSRAGFINQSVLVNVKDLAHITANLLSIKQSVAVSNIEDAQIIESDYSHAQITIPANAFVLPNGQPATGPVTVEFSPWDIQSADLNAMPANGEAIDAQGNRTNLISAGMITATFKNAAGDHLQLAKGQTADIQMDLPLTSINNQALAIGSKIPMWHFDEAKGLWVEEGEGQVIASQTSSTGLAVHATVSHFSTWNWDFKFDNGGKVFVQCKSATVTVPCHVTAQVKLDDGSSFTKVNSIPSEGSTVINMPSDGSILWTAKDESGTLIGEKTSGTTGTVIIDLGTPTTDNFVKCVTAEKKAVACSGDFNGIAFTVPAEGGRIISGLKNATNLTWTAASARYEQGAAVYQATGSVTSALKGPVTITLRETTKLFDQYKVSLRCNSSEAVPSYCTVNLTGNYYSYSAGSNVEQPSFYKQYRLPLNQRISVYLPIPPQSQVDWAWVSADGVLEKGNLQKLDYWSSESIYEDNQIQFDFDQVEWCDATMNNVELDSNNPPKDSIPMCWVPT